MDINIKTFDTMVLENAEAYSAETVDYVIDALRAICVRIPGEEYCYDEYIRGRGHMIVVRTTDKAYERFIEVMQNKYLCDFNHMYM